MVSGSVTSHDSEFNRLTLWSIEQNSSFLFFFFSFQIYELAFYVNSATLLKLNSIDLPLIMGHKKYQ